MNLNVLLELFGKDPRIFSIADRITMSKPQQLFLKNLHGSASQFVVAAIFQHPACAQINHLIVLNDAEEAAYFHNTLENLTNALDLFYFPSSFKNKKNFMLLNSSHVMLRTEALTKLSAGGNKKIIVTYPEALFEKCVLPKTISANIIRIKNGDTLDTSNLLEQFANYGFVRTDFVYQPGQFAVRGGILDIYSFGNEKPYRIELFGNEVDSIRVFDPESQLSERRLLQVHIIPNIETNFSSEKKTSLFEFLPENTIIWMHDQRFIREKMGILEKELKEFLESAGPKEMENVEGTAKKMVSAEDFIQAGDMDEVLINRHIVEFGAVQQPNAFTIEFHTRPQPAFNRRFERLIADLENWESKKFGIYLFADNPKQLERLHTIFEDLKSAIRFTPVATSIHEGFIDEDLKIVCYTDHEIFQRYHKYKIKQAYNK